MADLFRVRPGEKRETLEVDEVWSGGSPLPSGAKHVVPASVAGQHYLLTFDDKGKGSAFRVSASAPWIEPVASKIALGGVADIVEPFVIGNRPHLLAYVAESGTMSSRTSSTIRRASRSWRRSR